MCLGEYLKKRRAENNLSLNDVDRYTGIKNSTLSRIENNSNTFPEIKVCILKKLAKLYKINVIELFIKENYLDENDLSSHKKEIQNVEYLKPNEKELIQKIIDAFAEERKVIR